MSTFSSDRGQGDTRLTDQERQLVARLLSDPTLFPLEFRTWLKNYIESAGITVTASQIQGGGRITTGLPPGLIIACATIEAIPPDALACDHTEYPRLTYSQLFAKIGTKHGAGDGSTTFNVPDYRDRSLFGVGGAVAEATTDGQAVGTRSGAIHHHMTGRENHSLTSGTTSYALIGTASYDQPTTGGGNQDVANWASVIFAITTGRTG